MTPTGAAAALLCVAALLRLALALALELALLDAEALLAEALLALALAALPDSVDVTTTLVPWLVAVRNSVGMVVLNISVTGTAGARDVVSGVLVPTMLVSACWLLLSSDSVDTSTRNGWVCAHVDWV